MQPQDDSKLEAMAEIMAIAGNLPFAGPTTFCRLAHSRNLAGVEVAVLGAPLDIAVFNRSGARFGPRAIREMSLLVLTELATVRHFEGRRLVDYGDTWFAPGDLMHAHARIETDARTIVSSGACLLTLGGDHSITLPLLRAYAAVHGPVALLQFDSHTDLYDVWPQVYHGSGIARALQEGLLVVERSLQVGIRAASPAGAEGEALPQLDVDWVNEHGPAATVAAIRERVGDHPVYLTFDIDFLDPAYAPGTGTPVIGGPSTAFARQVMRGLKGLKVTGGDVVEVSPPYDNPGQITALAGASMAFYLLELMLAR